VSERAWSAVLDEDIPPTVASGAAVDATMLRSNDGEYATRLTVAGTRLGARTVHFKHTRSLERRQMRSWVRIDVNIPCRVTVMQKPEVPDPRPEGYVQGPSVGMVLEGRLLDLSGGGACARFPSPIPQGHRLSLNFDLPGSSLRGVETEVMRMTPVARAGREDLEHTLTFQSMETAFQEKIVRYVFEKQRIDSHLRGPTAS
jgi:c-di-GMP-binding flagellar brake protein YcgR